MVLLFSSAACSRNNNSCIINWEDTQPILKVQYTLDIKIITETNVIKTIILL